jgi:hypothetical protein
MGNKGLLEVVVVSLVGHPVVPLLRMFLRASSGSDGCVVPSCKGEGQNCTLITRLDLLETGDFYEIL